MFNAVSKFVFVSALALALCSCGDKAAEGARALYNSAEQLFQGHQYVQALDSLDSLNVRYAGQTQIRKEGLLLRAQIMEKIAIDSIEVSSANLAAATLALESSSAGVHHVDGPGGLEGYYLANGSQPAILTTTTVQPRVSDEGFLKIVANVSGKKIGLQYIQAVDGADTYRTANVSELRRITVGNSESATFDPEELDGFAPWLIAHPSVNKLTLCGSRGTAQVNLTPALRNQIIACYQFAHDTQALHLASVHREKYERMLATARQQIANLSQVGETR